MPAVELDAARLIGGSEADRSRVLERVHEYLEANASFDWGQLQDIWSGAPEAVFFNLNGHTYKGREHWTRLWQFYQPNDLAVIWCERHTHSEWIGRDPPRQARRYGVSYLALDDGVPQGSGRLARPAAINCLARAMLALELALASSP